MATIPLVDLSSTLDVFSEMVAVCSSRPSVVSLVTVWAKDIHENSDGSSQEEKQSTFN